MKWTKGSVHKEALKYLHRVDFQKNSSSAYGAALNNGYLDEVCVHMKLLRVTSRTIDQCLDIAIKYKSMIDFKKNENATYLYSRRRGWIQHITSHMKKNVRWKNRKDDIHKVALNFETRGEFCNKDIYHYEIARRWGWLDEICSHMKSVGNLYKRMVYVYEFEDKTSYIGLTCNERKRNFDHMNSTSSPVYKHMIKSKLSPIKKNLTNGYVESSTAQTIECEMIRYYKENGWKVLNISKSGGLGGSTRIWTMDKLIETASKYKTISEFRHMDKNAWSTMVKMNLIDKVCINLVNDDKVKWDDDNVKEIVNKYSNLKDLRKDYNVVISWIYRNNKHHLISNLINGNKQRLFINRWDTKEKIYQESLKYDTITMFRTKSGGAYKSAKQKGILDEVTNHMSKKFIWTKDKVIEIASKYTNYRKFMKENKNAYNSINKYHWEDVLSNLDRRNIIWTYDKIKEEALKYLTTKEFRINLPGGYQFARKKGYLKDITSHMTNSKSKIIVNN